MIATLLITATICVTGTLSHYAPAPTAAVIANRSVPGRTAWALPDNWREYDGLIAVEDCTELGTERDVWWQGHYGRMLAWDCAGDDATRRWMRLGIVGELDSMTARRWGARAGRGMRGARVCRVDARATRTELER
jgi:hypothetical protein